MVETALILTQLDVIENITKIKYLWYEIDIKGRRSVQG
jgi:hypothetical protein